MSHAQQASTWPINPAGGTGAVWVDGSGTWDASFEHLPSFVVGPMGEKTCWQAIGGAGAVAKFTGSDTVAVNLQAFPAQAQISGTYTFNPSGIFTTGATFAVSGNLTYNGGVYLNGLTGAGTATFTGAGPFMVGGVDLQWHANVKAAIGYTGTLNVPYRNGAPFITMNTTSYGATLTARPGGTAYISFDGSEIYCYTGANGGFIATPWVSDPELDAVAVTTSGITSGSIAASGSYTHTVSGVTSGAITNGTLTYTSGSAGTQTLNIIGTDSNSAVTTYSTLVKTATLGGVAWIPDYRNFFYWPATCSTNFTWNRLGAKVFCPTVFSGSGTIDFTGSVESEFFFNANSSSFSGSIIIPEYNPASPGLGAGIVVGLDTGGDTGGSPSFSIGSATLKSAVAPSAGVVEFASLNAHARWRGGSGTTVSVNCPQLYSGATNYISLIFEGGSYTFNGTYAASGCVELGDGNYALPATVAWNTTGIPKYLSFPAVGSSMSRSSAPNFNGNPYGTTQIKVAPIGLYAAGETQIMSWSGSSSNLPTLKSYTTTVSITGPVTVGSYTRWNWNTTTGSFYVELRPSAGLFVVSSGGVS